MEKSAFWNTSEYIFLCKKKKVGDGNETLGFLFSEHPMILPKSVNKQWFVCLFVYFHIQNYRLSNICRSETLQQVNDTNE